MKREWVVALMAAVIQRGEMTYGEALARADHLLRYVENNEKTAYPSYMDPH